MKRDNRHTDTGEIYIRYIKIKLCLFVSVSVMYICQKTTSTELPASSNGTFVIQQVQKYLTAVTTTTEKISNGEHKRLIPQCYS